MTQGDRRRANELRLVGDHRAGRVAEHAVDAHAELLELLASSSGDWLKVPIVEVLHVFGRSLARMIHGFTLRNFSMKPSSSTTRSRTIGKFARGSTSMVSPYSDKRRLAGQLGLAVRPSSRSCRRPPFDTTSDGKYVGRLRP